MKAFYYYDAAVRCAYNFIIHNFSLYSSTLYTYIITEVRVKINIVDNVKYTYFLFDILKSLKRK